MDDFAGVDFNFSFAPGVTDEQILGFEMAGEIWSHYLRDNVAVNIHDLEDFREWFKTLF